jgi:hypothetical protein
VRHFRTFSLLASCALGAVSAVAGTLNIGFESPYVAGANINGQQGWSNTGLYDAQVTNADAHTGTQSLRISNGITSGSFGDQTFTPHTDVASGESTVSGHSDEFLSSWYFKSVTDSPQVGLGISVSADNGSGARMTWVRMEDDGDGAGGLNLQFYDTDPLGNFVFHQLTTNLDRSTWHRVDMNIQFVDGPHNDVVDILLDGNLVYTGTTWEDFERFGPASDGGGGGITAVDSLLFRAGGAASNTLGAGFYIDDVSLTAEIPEPGSVALVLSGIAGLLATAKRRRG